MESTEPNIIPFTTTATNQNKDTYNG